MIGRYRLKRGRPLATMALVLASWATVRAMVWTPLEVEQTVVAKSKAPVAPTVPMRAEREAAPIRDVNRAPNAPVPGSPVWRTDVVPRSFVPSASAEWMERKTTPIGPEAPAVQPVSPTMAGGHAMLWMAAVARMPLLIDVSAAKASPLLSPAAPAPAPQYSGPLGKGAAPRRWSVDGWMMFRPDSGKSVPGAAYGTYGASQVGFLARYRLQPNDPHRSTAYLRGTSAANGAADREVAMGFATRPVAKVPVATMVEMRVTHFANGPRMRPAAFVVTEMPPIALPYETRAEFYGQAGYVAGEDATGFADGQLRVDRRVKSFSLGEVRAGAGTWGGAQEGASRLDVGPTVSLGGSLGGAIARVAVDWRVRVAGEAHPASGPALTLSAGF